MRHTVTTTLGDVKFMYDGHVAKAIVDGEIINEKSPKEIENYDKDVITDSEHLIAFVEMYVLNGGKLNKIKQLT